ncbi:hypothetical protein [Flagellimonas allohymeniacidonis]|uniref:Uncharacterized protein n=1 Tax=Flagellimonas allohymeniacidonis TaxID=2517819 RepID=A0A4Q8QFC4_9FLAO|nr:hypothetical protein [Allomuricauda hymeniacidonis]TAI46796.1 hypothetical protein EW142_08830 [Allomuricauda hymeniacidonis]
MKRLFHLLLLFSSLQIVAQAPTAGDLVGIHNVTDTEMSNIANPIEGSMVYNTTTRSIHFFSNGAWVEVPNVTNTYMGTFQISNTGNQTISGIPFEPNSVTFWAYANVENFNLNSDNGVGNNNSGIANSFGSMTGFARNDGGSITEQVIYVGGSGNSINDISRYASNSHSIGLRYGNQNGNNLGITSATVTRFNSDGFLLNTDSFADGIVVIFQAFR